MKSWSWKHAVSSYVDMLEERAYAATSVTILSRWLRVFADFCVGLEVAVPAAVTSGHVDAWHGHLLWSRGKTDLYRPTTVDQALRAVRGFFQWAVREDKLFMDPTRHLVLRRAPRGQPTLLTPEQMDTLLNTPDPLTPGGLRDRAVLELLYSTGLRRGECLGLDVDDVDFASQAIRVRYGKGQRQRLMPLGDHLAGVLQRYLEECRPQLMKRPEEPALFLSKFGTRYGAESMGKMVRETARKAGLGRVFPHAIRHMFASHLLEAGADLEDIRRLMGHDFLQSTQTYTQLAPRQLRRTYRRTHPHAG